MHGREAMLSLCVSTFFFLDYVMFMSSFSRTTNKLVDACKVHGLKHHGFLVIDVE
jgi:hypothetical protein